MISSSTSVRLTCGADWNISQILDGLWWNEFQIFMFPCGWIVITDDPLYFHEPCSVVQIAVNCPLSIGTSDNFVTWLAWRTCGTIGYEVGPGDHHILSGAGVGTTSHITSLPLLSKECALRRQSANSMMEGTDSCPKILCIRNWCPCAWGAEVPLRNYLA